jgi:hypothetical protein
LQANIMCDWLEKIGAVKGSKLLIWCMDDKKYKDTLVLEEKDGNEFLIWWMNIKGLWTFVRHFPCYEPKGEGIAGKTCS